jgi:tetratricopeptide (TPR) repeat protein
MPENSDAIDQAVDLHDTALAALDRHQASEALTFAEHALELFEREAGPLHPDVANVLNCMGTAHDRLGNYDLAKACFERAVAIMRDVRTRASGKDIDRLYVQSLIGLGNMDRITGRYAEAEPSLREALSLAEASLGSDDDDVITALNALGVLSKYWGRFDDAEKCYERAIRIAERNRVSGECLATLLHNLGGLEHARGEYARGEEPARRSVHIRERMLGPHHPSVAADVAALAALVEGQGRYEEAEQMYRRVLATFERIYGPNHYEIAVNLNNLAGVREALGHPAEAETLYRRALAIKEQLFGPDHPDVAMTLNNLALLLASHGRLDEADALYSRALRTFSERLEPGHPKIRGCVENYSALLREQGRTAAAQELESRFK